MAVRRRLPSHQRWLAAYGAFSLLAGTALRAVLASVFWATIKELVIALFTGSITDILIGVYYVGTLVLGRRSASLAS